jgi:hypothetical protein
LFSIYSEDNLPDGWKVIDGADFIPSDGHADEFWWMFVLEAPDQEKIYCQNWRQASEEIDAWIDEKSRTS